MAKKKKEHIVFEQMDSGSFNGDVLEKGSINSDSL